MTFGRLYYERVLREYRPHLVFSVHDCLNRGYFQLARKILGPEQRALRHLLRGILRRLGLQLELGRADGGPLFLPHPHRERLRRQARLSRAKARVRGYLMQPRAYLEILTPRGAAALPRAKARPPPRSFHGVPGHGGNGANNHFELLPALVRHADRVQAIVICGRNNQTYNELVHWRAQHPEFYCFIEGFSDVMHLLMQASDAIVTRGGTTTCAKALHFKCPIIFNAFGGIMPQERLTVKFFRNGAAAEVVQNEAQFRAVIDRWMADPAAYQRALENFLQLRYEEDPTVLIEELVGLAASVAGIKLDRLPFPPPPSGDGNGL